MAGRVAGDWRFNVWPRGHAPYHKDKTDLLEAINSMTDFSAKHYHF